MSYDLMVIWEQRLHHLAQSACKRDESFVVGVHNPQNLGASSDP